MKIEVNNAVFSLPYHVAQEEGFFRDEGVDVELVPAGSGRDRNKEVPEQPIEDHRAVTSYGWHEGIERGEFCMYRACEWGQIRRTQDSREGARVISKRAAVATQAIVVRGDSPCNVPADLANVLVGVNMHAGSHYVTLALLEGSLKRHEIRPGHVGGPRQRLRFLEDGRVGAAALMEPWITVAVRRGHKIVCEAFYEGAEVGVPSLDPDGYARVDRAIRRAVDRLNENIVPYLKYMIREVPKEIAELRDSDFYLNRFRYVYPRPYTAEDYERLYEWMVGWDLLSPESRFEVIVDRSRASAIRAFVLAAAIGCSAAPLAAHHSFGAEYDVQRPLALTGVVSKVEWTNPHCHIYLDVPDGKGSTVNWKLEGYPVVVLARNGWRRDVTLKAGDRITVTGWGARDGGAWGHSREVTLPTGEKMIFGPPAGTGDGGTAPVVEVR